MQVLKEQETVLIRHQKEEVQGFACLVVEASGLHGKYTLWVDPERGYTIVKATVHKGMGNWAFGRTMGTSANKYVPVTLTELSFDMSDVRCECVNGVWVPMEATWTITTKYSSPKVLVFPRTVHARRTFIDLKPDFAALHAFAPIIPNGTPVVLGEEPGIPYVWRGDRFVPDVNSAVVARIDHSLEQITQGDCSLLKAWDANAPVAEGAAGPSPCVVLPPAVVSKDSPKHCGIYCIYAASKLLGKPVEMVSLFKPDYVGSSRGSTLQELVVAARDLGLNAKPMNRMTRGMLERCPYPVILHVKSTNGQYGHWVLYHGTSGGKARIFDPPNDPELMSFGGLDVRWRGLGLVVSTEPIRMASIAGPSQAYVGAIIGLAALGTLGLRRALAQWSLRFSATPGARWRQSFIQAAAFCIIAGAAGIACASLLDNGLLSNAEGRRYILEVQRGRFLPKLSLRSVEALSKKATVLVDARIAADFDAGHLEGAISVPVSSTDKERQDKMTGVAKGSKVIVYCQSSRCQFAEKIAKGLLADGYKDVSIFKGGWVLWEIHHPIAKKEVRT